MTNLKHLTAERMSVPRVAPHLAQATPIARHRFHLLDALRGLAAIVVVIFHAPAALKGPANFPNSFLAVDFFFCLSGFVVAFSYEQRLRGKLRLLDFTAIRLIRLYPLYALGTLLALVRGLLAHSLLGVTFTLRTILGLAALAAVLLPNLLIATPSPLLYPLNFPAWSLFYEVCANVLFALLLRLQWQRVGLPALAIVSLLVLTWKAISVNAVDFGAFRQGFWLAFARIGFSFSAGVLLLRLFRRHGAPRLHGRRSWALAAGAIILLLATLTIDTAWARTGLYQLLAIGLIFPLIVHGGARCALPALADRLCTWLGDLSYPLYMLHIPLMRLRGFNLDPTLAPLLPYVSLLYLAVLIGLSSLAGTYLDAPVRRRLTAFWNKLQQHAV